MSERSSTVTQSREEKLRSALVQALDTWQTPYDIRPEGVFGSKAIIKCRDVVISSDELDVEFTIPFDDNMEPNEAEIIIYNLADETINRLKSSMHAANSAITVEAGYTGDTGVIFTGYIRNVRTSYSGADKVTTIKALDDVFYHAMESIAFAAGTKASYILNKLLEKTDVPIAVFNPRRDHTYNDSQTVDGNLMENIKRYAEVCGISAYVSRGKIYARHIKEGDNLRFEISSDTGMIGYPAPYTEEINAESFTEIINGYEVTMLLQHRMCAGAITNLSSKITTGQYRVCSGTHRFSQDEAVTELKMY